MDDRKTVVITGSTGFIGSALVRTAAAEGDRVFAVMRPGSVNACRLEIVEKSLQKMGISPDINVVECGIDEMEKLPELIGSGCDIFYHIGWANTGRDRNASAEGQMANIEFTRTAVRSAKLLGCSRFLGAGSQAEYGPKPCTLIMPDGKERVLSLEELKSGIPEGCEIRRIAPEDETEPFEYYGKAKLEAMKEGAASADSEEIDFIWARIFSTYGENDKLTTMISDGIIRFLKGDPGEFTEGIHIWDYMHVDDMARALYLAGKKGRPGAVYCLGSGRGRQLREYINIMAEAVDPDLQPGIGKKPYPSSGVRNICADISSLTRDTGFVPRISFEEGIRRTVEDIRTRI